MSQGVEANRLRINEWVRDWRLPMVRFARLHLPSPDDAEDVVQDCFEAVLNGAAQSADDPRRYLFGMLRHKVTDRLRLRYREGAIKDSPDGENLDDILFDSRGLWATGMAPAAWVLCSSRPRRSANPVPPHARVGQWPPSIRSRQSLPLPRGMSP